MREMIAEVAKSASAIWSTNTMLKTIMDAKAQKAYVLGQGTCRRRPANCVDVSASRAAALSATS